MNLGEFKKWLEPISDELEVRIFVAGENEDRLFYTLTDVDINNKKFIIDGQFKNPPKPLSARWTP